MTYKEPPINGHVSLLSQETAADEDQTPVSLVLEAVAGFHEALKSIAETEHDQGPEAEQDLLTKWVGLQSAMAEHLPLDRPEGFRPPSDSEEAQSAGGRIMEIKQLVTPLLAEAAGISFTLRHPDAQPLESDARQAARDLGGLCLSTGATLVEGAMFTQ